MEIMQFFLTTSNPNDIQPFASFGVDSPRGIAATSSFVVVAASGTTGSIFVFSYTGQLLQTISVAGEAVGTYFSPNSNLLYVSVKDTHRPAISAYDPLRQFALVFSIPLLLIDNHPTGIVEFGGVLYCLGQQSNSLFTVNLTTRSFLRTLVKFTDFPEQLILSSICV